MKANKRTIVLIVSVFALAGIYAISGNGSSDPGKARKEKIEKMFNPWNGEHTKLKEMIKANMNDPESYEHIETTFSDLDTVIIVNQKYSGKNAFGGRVQGVVEASVDLSGNVISILEER